MRIQTILDLTHFFTQATHYGVFTLKGQCLGADILLVASSANSNWSQVNKTNFSQNITKK